MTLKNVFQNDLKEVFFDFEEFADFHTIGDFNKKILMVKEGDISKANKEKLNAKYEGYYGLAVTIHARTSDLPEIYVEDTKVRFDGEIYEVAISEEDMGITTITLVSLNA